MLHPPIEVRDKYYYYTDIFYEYPIGRLLDYFTKKMLDNNILFSDNGVNDKGYDKNGQKRPHDKTYPYNNVILYDSYTNGKDSYDTDLYELKFYIREELTVEQKKFITSMFCNHDDYNLSDNFGNVNDTKNWVYNIRFNNTGEISVRLFLSKAIGLIRKDKISKLLEL
jgi:hypothetical protein